MYLSCVTGRTTVSLGIALIVAGAALAQSPSPSPHGDPVRGKALYEGCTGCHSLDENDVGPRHRGVVGRKAGSLADYSYSAALKGSGITWDLDNLDRWLINPQGLVPGTKMYFSLADPQSRADIIAFLAEQK